MLNRVMIIGNMGRDPELRYTPSGTPVASFTVAVNSVFGSGEQRREDTEWFNVVAWNRLAEIIAQYGGKGRKVFVEGRLKTRTWQDQHGQRRSKTEVIAQSIQLLDRSPTTTAEPETAGNADFPSTETDEFGFDDVTF